MIPKEKVKNLTVVFYLALALIISSPILSASGPFLLFADAATAQDSVAPIVSITSPSNNAVISGPSSGVTVKLSGTSSDSISGVRTVQVRTQSTSYETATPKSPGDFSTWTHSLVLTPGTYSITARASDYAENRGWFTITVKVVASTTDSTPPTISITSPSNGVSIPGSSSGASVNISGTSSDSGSGVGTVEVRTQNIPYKTATPKSPGDWSTWSTSLSLSQGTHTIVARATDKAGNQQWRIISIAVSSSVTDSTPPVVSITSPSSGSTITGPSSGVTVSITGRSSDSGSGVQLVEVRTHNTSYFPATPKSPGDWSNWSHSRVLPPGSHTLIAKATDKSGNTSWYTISIVTATASSTSTDKFGVKKLFETKSGGREWFAKWDSNPRTFTYGWDPYDAEFQIRGNVNSFKVNGDGTVRVSGDQPRFYIHDKTNSKNWQNVEMTYYVKRISESQYVSYQAFTAGARNGWAESKDNCDGFGYYGMMKFNGQAVFQKELINHVAYSTLVPYPWPKPWPNSGPFHTNEWVGIKFVVRNMDANTHVKIELYLDTTNGLNGGNWKKVTEYIDDGNWWASGEPWGDNNYTWIDCGSWRKQNWIITNPYPTVMLRTDYISAADYKKFSVREINPLP